MKKIYEKPMAELVSFQAEEAITTSVNIITLTGFDIYPVGSGE